MVLNYKTIISQAQQAAKLCYDDVAEPSRLAPSNYDGDGEAWSFDYSDGHLGDQDDATRDDSKECYLAAFWLEIERLKTYEVR